MSHITDTSSTPSRVSCRKWPYFFKWTAFQQFARARNAQNYFYRACKINRSACQRPFQRFYYVKTLVGMLRDESRSFYCSSTPESEWEGKVPLYYIFVTQRAPLGSASRQCYSVFQQQLQLEGVQPQMLCKLCFSTAASTQTPGWRGVSNSFPSGFGDTVFLLRPIIRERRGGFLLHISSFTPKPRSFPSGIRSRFRLASDLEARMLPLSFGVRTRKYLLWNC